jgi:dTDP-4-dehydrorhamnose reductase
VIRALVTGCRGQVGADVAALLAGRAEVAAHDRSTLDLEDARAIVRCVRDFRPDLIVNAAAYTAVDRAEAEPERAGVVNAIAPGVFAAEAKALGALLVHYSTDYVFDGTKPAAYVETDATGPLGAYGRTKLAGEEAIAASGCPHLILRTSWVYAPRGRNFLLTMLEAAKTREELRVVDDQRGAPTPSRSLARATLDILAQGDRTRPITREDLARAGAASGRYHATAQSETSWFGFAQAIFERQSRLAAAPVKVPRLVPIPTSAYPTPARRPANSVLSNAKLAATFGVQLPHWEEGLQETLEALAGK